MNEKDVLWQRLLDEEKLRLSSLPAEELLSMEFFTRGIIQSCEIIVEYGIWHEVHSEDPPSMSGEAQNLSAQLDGSVGVRKAQRESHSFVLKASRTLFPGIHRNYLAGFSLDDAKNVIPMSGEIFGAHD